MAEGERVGASPDLPGNRYKIEPALWQCPPGQSISSVNNLLKHYI